MNPYHDDIVISSKSVSNTNICVKKINHDVLRKNWYNILKAASEIIRRDIRVQVYDNENYTPRDKMLEDIGESILKYLFFYCQK